MLREYACRSRELHGVTRNVAPIDQTRGLTHLRGSAADAPNEVFLRPLRPDFFLGTNDLVSFEKQNEARGGADEWRPLVTVAPRRRDPGGAVNRWMSFAVTLSTLGVAGVYLFVTAPPPLEAVEAPTIEARIPIRTLFELVNEESSSVRRLYTEEIVGAGQKAGLRFGEDWRRNEEATGPLPALFLRETAAAMERREVQMRFFLGSDQPINRANGFSGAQADAFRTVKETRGPVFFLDRDTGAYTAMFPDFASASACVACHNEHEGSPRKDWALGDVMGAVTWTYPKDAVTPAELAEVLDAFNGSVADAYGRYLEQVRRDPKGPPIGDRWPRDGVFLPSSERFVSEMWARTASATFARTFQALRGRG